MSWSFVALALAITLLAGFVKGAVGFAMPMIMISGLGSFMPPALALAALILPTLACNTWQAMRQGPGAAAASASAHRVYLAILLVFILITAQFVTALPTWLLLLILGAPVTLFAILQLIGWRPRLHAGNRRAAEVGIGAFSGAIGGLSGVWGPPTVLYLTALDTPKVEQVRVQGVIYGLGAVMLTLAHMRSGILNRETVELSLILTGPALIGMWLGFLVQDRLDQDRFRKITLIVLVVAGLNLIRRAVIA
ncbi:MAG: sulfite exporter TauE/SafE family protein [Silicimonas sp.]|nr:sulfite exporter TauE/SafE family protein [Silicimonas sp.]